MIIIIIIKLQYTCKLYLKVNWRKYNSGHWNLSVTLKLIFGMFKLTSRAFKK